MAEFKQVKLNEEVKSELDSLKYYDNDSYSSVIKRLIEENKQLKEDKKNLFKILLETEDSVALVNNVHKATYFIANVIEDKTSSEEEKLQVLETYLAEIIVNDPTSVLDGIDILKDSASGSSLDILIKFENYVKSFS